MKRDGSYSTVMFDQGLIVHKCLDQERLVHKWLIKGLNVYSARSGKNRTEVHDHGLDVSRSFIRDDNAKVLGQGRIVQNCLISDDNA